MPSLGRVLVSGGVYASSPIVLTTWSSTWISVVSSHRPILLKLDFIELQTHSFSDLSGHQFGVLIPLHTPSEDTFPDSGCQKEDETGNGSSALHITIY